MKVWNGIAGAAFAALAANLLTGNAMSDGPSKPDARGKYAEVNGLRMYYEDHGAGGVPLVLMHKADFLGYSNGGHIAIEVALRHPEVVRKLVIESAMFDRSGSDPGFWESFKTAKLEDMPKELREAYVRVAPRPEDLPVYFAKSVRRMAEFKGWSPDQIRSIKAPTLVLVGDADIVHPEHAAAMFRLLPRGRLAVLPGVDHMTIVDRADLLLAIVPPFLDAPDDQR
jgi:pimeloyl-ACP methyl ester carboxylesterase